MGFVNKADSEPLLDAFSHWTYMITGRSLIVVDLQGVKEGNKFVLTDPAIHTIKGNKFGDCNHSMTGIKSFFHTHICNSICKDIELEEENI